MGAWILLPGGGTGNWKDQSGVTCGLSGKYDQGSFQKAGLAQVRHGGNRGPGQGHGKTTGHTPEIWQAGESREPKHICGTLCENDKDDFLSSLEG